MGTILPATIRAAKFDYEFLGRSTKEIAELYSLPEASLKAEIQQQSWTRKFNFPTPQTDDLETLEDFARGVDARAKAQLLIMSSYRQLQQQSLLAAVEDTLLEKSMAILGSLSSSDPSSAAALTSIMRVVSAIQERQQTVTGKVSTQELEEGNKVVVQIQNNIT